jgi:tetratricopeptide (TPR) repeat protein
LAIGPALTLLTTFAFQPPGCGTASSNGQENGSFPHVLALYWNGPSREAVRALEALGPRAIERAIEGRAAGIDGDCVEAASLLVTELAMSLAGRSRWEDADRYFDSAWTLSQRIEPPGRRLAYQRNWLLAAGLFQHGLLFSLEGEEPFVRADSFLREAVERYPHDAEALLAAGALLEWAGSLRFGKTANLEAAAKLYARALKEAPSDPETLLRHGRVLEKLGKADDSKAALLRVLELPAKDDVHYRSRMDLGRMAEREGRLAEAIEHYGAAASLIPSWQPAHLALAHSLHVSGSHELARETLDSALSIRAEEADEAFGGWWSYELGIALRLDPLLGRMRTEARR